jgi:SAM-dependent methyltransferase
MNHPAKNKDVDKMEEKKVREFVRKGYAQIANQKSSCCTPLESCCGSEISPEEISRKIGYTEKELTAVPRGANLGLGCGNPVALASLQEGETVLDLGAGAGFDCFLASQKVGKQGHVIGVDMTPEMVERARENARKHNYQNVEFRLGEIENLPAADNSVDAIISNCVINLSPDKRKTFREAFRVLKPGGRLMISDIVLLKELPDVIVNSIEAYISCLSGAMMKDHYLQMIEKAGFSKVKVIDESSFPLEYMVNDPTAQTIIKNLNISPEMIQSVANSVISIKVRGIKPK